MSDQAGAPAMTEHELHGMWGGARLHIIVSGIAPTLLLAAALALVVGGLGAQPAPIKLAAALVLLSSGILGAAVQISAASEAQAVAVELAALPAPGPVSRSIIASAERLWIVKLVTPTVFVLTYLALLWAIFAPPLLGGMMPGQITTIPN